MSSTRPWRSSSEAERVRAGRPVLMWLAVAVSLAVLFFVLRAASSPPPPQTVRGVVLDVQASSLLHAERITLRADDGRVWTFRVDPEVATNGEEPQSASHLRQHMAFGEPLLVRFRETESGPLALRIFDAP
jgi:hypothetical protein